MTHKQTDGQQAGRHTPTFILIHFQTMATTLWAWPLYVDGHGTHLVERVDCMVCGDVISREHARLHNVGAHPGVINNSNDDMGVASLSVDGHAWLVYRFV